MKHFLRNKANFTILEGFLSVLLGEAIHINRLLESEGNNEELLRQVLLKVEWKDL